MRPLLRNAATLTLTLSVLACAQAADEPATEEAAPAPAAQDSPSLYARLGEEEAIAAVVSRFIDVLSEDAILNANPAILEARDNVDPDQLKAHVTAMVCQATGGPQEYTGRTMAESHAHMNISGSEWDQMIVQFVAVLDEFGVGEAEKDELLAIMESTKADIVLRPDE